MDHTCHMWNKCYSQFSFKFEQKWLTWKNPIATSENTIHIWSPHFLFDVGPCFNVHTCQVLRIVLKLQRFCSILHAYRCIENLVDFFHKTQLQIYLSLRATSFSSFPDCRQCYLCLSVPNSPLVCCNPITTTVILFDSITDF